MRLIVRLLVSGLLGALLPPVAWAAEPPAATDPVAGAGDIISNVYPGLASGVLAYAKLAQLPEGILLKSGSVMVIEDDLKAVGADAPAKIREQLRKNAFFVLEHVATSKVLLALARQEATKDGQDLPKTSDNELVRGYFKGVLDGVAVADNEVADFYNQNRSMFGGAKLETVKQRLAQYLLQQKQQEVIRKHIELLGQKVPIEVSASWVKVQSTLSRDNPVDKARLSGKPSLVDFGRGGCGPCDMMTPILKALKKKYEGKANVLFVHVGEEEILAMRYGIKSIPVQVFFDKDGKEVFRHTGFFPQAEIEKKLAELGVK